RIETAEIHLATNFQNLLFDNIPSALRERIYRWLDENTKDERKPTDSDEQFYYKTRKKALGPFKRDFWDLDAGVKATLAGVYDRTFGFLFEQLKVGNTADIVARHVQAPAQHRSLEATREWPRPPTTWRPANRRGRGAAVARGPGATGRPRRARNPESAQWSHRERGGAAQQ